MTSSCLIQSDCEGAHGLIYLQRAGLHLCAAWSRGSLSMPDATLPAVPHQASLFLHFTPLESLYIDYCLSPTRMEAP